MSNSSDRIKCLVLREKGQHDLSEIIWVDAPGLISVKDRYLALKAKTDLAQTYDVTVQYLPENLAYEWCKEFEASGMSVAPRVVFY